MHLIFTSISGLESLSLYIELFEDHHFCYFRTILRTFQTARRLVNIRARVFELACRGIFFVESCKVLSVVHAPRLGLLFARRNASQSGLRIGDPRMPSRFDGLFFNRI